MSKRNLILLPLLLGLLIAMRGTAVVASGFWREKRGICAADFGYFGLAWGLGVMLLRSRWFQRWEQHLTGQS
ncbi:MAG: hypothetical protein HC805_03290 [Alkalinema sp. RL_2_19]|nr:hypothetical protein [Alkalinema sp. RL_2_19]